MKNYILLALSLLILKHSAFAQSPLISADLDLLQGVWKQACANRNARTETFQASMVTLSEVFYSDSQCEAGLIEFINEGSFDLPRQGHMDFKFTSVRVRLKHANFVEDFNLRKVCGFSDWQLEVEKEISGRLCEIFGSPQRIPAVGDMRYGIYHLKSDQLLFGQLTREQNAMSPEKRPTNFDPRPYIKTEGHPNTTNALSSGL